MIAVTEENLNGNNININLPNPTTMAVNAVMSV